MLPRIPTTATVWLIVSIAWILHGIAYADELVAFPAIPERPLDWPMALAQAFVESVACWIVLSVALVETVRRLPLAGPRRWQGFALLAGAIVAVIVARAAYIRAIYPLLECFQPGTTQIPPFADILARSFRLHTVRVVLIVGVSYAWFYQYQTRASRRRIAELESGLARARADALSAPLNPDFIFNALAAIGQRIHADQDASDRLLVALSSLLRSSLADPRHEVTVREEAALAAQFIALERVRIDAPLELAVAVEPGCAHALVPALILQPLLARAVARRPATGIVHVTMRHDAGTLVIEIDSDDAATPRDDAPIAVRERLQRLYGSRGALTLGPGGQVRVELPLHYAAQAPAAATIAA